MGSRIELGKGFLVVEIVWTEVHWKERAHLRCAMWLEGGRRGGGGRRLGGRVRTGRALGSLLSLERALEGETSNVQWVQRCS